MPRTSYAPPARRRAPVRRKAPVRKPRNAVAYSRVPRSLGMVAPARISSSGGAFRSAGSGVGAAIGTALGGPAGGALGGLLGRGAGAVLSKIMGHGDYAVSNAPAVTANSLLVNASNIPQFGTGKVAVNFKHREFIGDVFSSSTPGAFTINSYPINPGIQTSFPWLAGVVGANFQQYRINGMTYEYRSMSSDALNSTNTALGSVIMATDYDSADSVFGNKQEMENTEYGVSCKPSVNMLHAIECSRTQTPVSELYIRAFNVPSGKDIRMYDLGRFSIATVGFQGTNVNCGELWCTYDIDCFKAIEQAPGFAIPFAQYNLTTGAKPSVPLGTAPVADNIDQIGMTFTANKIQWPNNIENGSIWQVSCLFQQDTGYLQPYTPPVVTAGNGMTVLGCSFNAPFNAADVRDWGCVYFVKYDGTGTPASLPYLNIANYTWISITSLSYATVNISQVSGIFNT